MICDKAGQPSTPRPLYETSSDVMNEVSVKSVVETETKCNLHKLPMDYRVDYAMTKYSSAIIGGCEIKCRKNASNKYPTYMISFKKISEGLRLSELTQQPFYLFIQFTDKLLYYHVKTTDPLEYRMGGRTVQTRDVQDIEPVVYIPMELFREVKL